MKILVTGVTGKSSQGASATVIYRIFEKVTLDNNHYNIIDDITKSQWCIDRKDVIIIEDEIPEIDYNPYCYSESEECYNNVSKRFLDDFTLNSYNKLTGKEHFTDEEFFNRHSENDNNFYWKKVIKDFFGDRVDIQDGFFIVYFPIKHVQNSSGRQHTIYDVYLKVDISYQNTFRQKYLSDFSRYFSKFLENSNSNPCFSLVSGTRTRASQEEYSSSYVFSHFSRGFDEWRNTCLGEGLLSKYRNIPISSEEFAISYCVALENYLSWESLEGGPYIKISDIRSNNTNESVPYSVFREEMIKSLMANKFNNLILDINGNKVYITDSSLDEVNSFYTINGNCISLDKLNKSDKNTSNTTEIVGSNFFTFNGKKLGTLTIDYSLNKTSAETIFSGELDVYRLHYQSIKNQLIDKINNIINDKSNNFLEKKPLFRID